MSAGARVTICIRSEQELAAAEEIRAETGAEVLTVSADLTTLPPSHPEDPPA